MDVTRIRPVQDQVIIRRLADDEQRGSIYVPESARDAKRPEGIVVAVGPGRYNRWGVFIPTQVKVGEHVIFQKWHGTENRKSLGPDHIVLPEEHVLAVLEPD